jgi:arylsulfatase A-like enzyme
MDVLPTLAKLAGAEPPAGRQIDGHDIWPLLSGSPDAKSPYEAFYYYWNYRLEGIRDRRWKLVFPHDYTSLSGKPGSGGTPGGYSTAKTELALYDLANDPKERTDVAEKQPEVVARLTALAETARDDLGDALQKRQGKGIRPSGKIAEP